MVKIRIPPCIRLKLNPRGCRRSSPFFIRCFVRVECSAVERARRVIHLRFHKAKASNMSSDSDNFGIFEPVADVKKKVNERLGKTPDQKIRFIFGGRVLDDAMNMVECGIEKESCFMASFLDGESSGSGAGGDGGGMSGIGAGGDGGGTSGSGAGGDESGTSAA